MTSEADGLLRRQVDHDEAVDAGGLAVLEHLLLAVCQERVVVAHQHDGSLEALCSCVPDHLQADLCGGAILEGDGVCCLDGRAVRNGVCEGDSELDHVGAASLEAQEDVDTLSNGRVTGRDVADEGRAVLALRPGKGRLDAVDTAHSGRLCCRGHD